MANWANVGNVGNPLAPGWQRQNLVPVTAGGQSWQVYRPAAASFQGLLDELVAMGYPLKSSGGFNYRNIRGSDRLSQHAFGTAIDINAGSNPLGSTRTDIPNAAALAAKYGLEWGGSWKGRKDPMHFEYRGDGSASPVEAPGTAMWSPGTVLPFGLPSGPEDAAVAAYMRPMPFMPGYGFQDFMQAGISGTLRNDLRSAMFGRIGKLFGV